MNIISRLFVLLNEVLLFILILLPIPYVIREIKSGPMANADWVWLAATVFGYFVFIVILFGSLALVVENNRSLKRIVTLLEAQAPNAKRSEPTIKREPNIRSMSDSQDGTNSSSSGRIEPKL